MKTSPAGVQYIKGIEQFRGKAYLDKLAKPPVWTVGYGFTGPDIGPDTIMTQEEADFRILEMLEEREEAVTRFTRPNPPTQAQFDAMVSLVWNIGVENFRKSSVLRAHNRGDYAAAAQAFKLFNKSGGVVRNGLIRRRNEEAAMYLTPIMETEPMPQVIDPEPKFTESNINKAGLITAATGSAGVVVETLNTLNAVKQGVDGLREWLLPVLLLAVVGLSAYIVWTRIGMRKRGVA